MALYVNNKYAKSFVTDEEIYSYQDKITKAHNDLHNKTGAGNDFTGWVFRAVNFNKLAQFFIKPLTVRAVALCAYNECRNVFCICNYVCNFRLCLSA